MNLEGYANLENWVAELDKRIESILLARLQHVIVLWCAEFERSDEDARREPVALRDVTNKRRDKRKDEKVRSVTKSRTNALTFLPAPGR